MTQASQPGLVPSSTSHPIQLRASAASLHMPAYEDLTVAFSLRISKETLSEEN